MCSLEKLDMDLRHFWEFANAYCKMHVKFWILSATLSSGSLLLLNPLMTPVLMLMVFTFYIIHSVKLSWNDDKIRNLILYKQLTGQPLSHLEQQAIDQYFGKYQRKKIILELAQKQSYTRLVWLVDVICVVLIGVSIYFGWTSMPSY